MSAYNSNHQRIIDNQSEPEQPSSILECPNETGTWLAENMAETIQTRAIELIGDFLTGPQDSYAVRKMQGEIAVFAWKCEEAIRADEERDRRNAE